MLGLCYLGAVICRSNSFRFFMLVLLMAAQLYAIAHAVEHGIGEHEHESLPCVYVAANDHDQDGIIPPRMAVAMAVVKERSRDLSVDHTRYDSDFIVPPSTGPPL